MLFGVPLRNTSDYLTYLQKHLQVGGIWIGSAADHFCVTEGRSVQPHEFRALEDNLNPITGERITRRKNKVRQEWKTDKGGRLVSKTVPNRRRFWDFTISCPKSFSVLGLVGGKDCVMEWHDAAIKKTLSEMERLTSCWHKAKNNLHLEMTGKFVACRCDHQTNRSLEPHLHSHIIIFNMTPSKDGKHYGIESRVWMDRKKYLLNVYWDCLAAQALKAGYELSRDEFGSPQIKGIEDLNPIYSQRSNDIHQMVETIEEFAGTTLTDAERKRLVIASRGIDIPQFRRIWATERSKLELAKISYSDTPNARRRLLSGFEAIVRHCSDGGSEETDQAKIREIQIGLLDPEQRHRLERIHTGLREGPPFLPLFGYDGSLQFAARYLFERRSVCQDHEVLAKVLDHAQGADIDLDQLRQAFHTMPGLIHRNGEVTTQIHFQRETQIFEWIESGKGQGIKIGQRLDSTLNSAQLRAANELLDCDDQFTALIGKAGVGKSTVANFLISANLEAGYRVSALAPSTRARDVLDHGDKATLQRFLVDPALQSHLVPKDLVVLDEASFASVEQIHRLFTLAQANQWRVCLIGDPRQNVSVEAGDALRILLRRTTIKREWLEKIIRQDPLAMEGRYLRAAKLFAQGKSTEGFSMLDKAGAIHVAHGQQRIDEMAKLFHAELSFGRSVICCNPSHRENDLVNQAIRERLKAEGVLKDEQLIQVHRSMGWTLAERQQLSRLRPGLVLEITQGKDKGQVWEVRQVECDRAYAVRNDQRRRFDKGNADVWQVCQRRTIPVSIGDDLITGSGRITKGKEMINGEKFTVAGFQFRHSEISAILTTNGKVIETRNLDYAYAGTTHRYQGSTADTVIFGIDRNSVRWANKKIAYVSATRGRKKVAIFCESKADLVQLDQREGDRKSAIEMIKRCIKNSVLRKHSLQQKQAMAA